MISKIRNSIFTKALWGLMALYLLNIGVDAPDAHPEHIAEDLSFNDQESIIEIFVEQILGYENALKEYDDTDVNDHNKEKNAKIDLLVHQIIVNKNTQLQFTENKRLFVDSKGRLANGFIEIDSPPPKV